MGIYSKRTKNIKENSAYYMFGLHAVKAAIKNPNRKIHELWISQNARAKIFTDNMKFPTYPFLISINQKIYQFQKIKFIKELF